jgi:hypothetical protein
MIVTKIQRGAKTWGVLLVLATAAAAAHTSAAPTPDANAKSLMKAMSDYMAAQKAISYDYDTYLEVVTTQNQKLGLASSGAITLNRPDKVHVARTGGFANVELVYDGRTLTMIGKNANAYAQTDAPGTVDQLVDALRNKFHRPLPGADLVMSNVYDQLMPEVVDAKDLGSGVIDGVECDHLAFREKSVDWEIWIAEGSRPYPCRYVITSTQVSGSPQYTIDVRKWKTGTEVAFDDFKPRLPQGAKKLNPGDLRDYDELPAVFLIKRKIGGQ